MTCSVLKVPLNPNQPTNQWSFVQGNPKNIHSLHIFVGIVSNIIIQYHFTYNENTIPEIWSGQILCWLFDSGIR